MLARIEPFWSWHTPIAWTGFLFFVDGWIWRRRGESPLRNDRAEMVFLALASIPLWIVFEEYNKYALHNWHYVGLPETLLVRYIGYAWAFATIWPAILLTAELIRAMRDRRAPEYRRADPMRIPLGVVGWLSVAAGAAMLVWPILRPSPWLAAPVWLGFIFLLDPINARLGGDSFGADLRHHKYDRLANLALSGLLCGVLWEFWNYWSRAKWHYTVPIMENLKIFEMPVPGYFGFPAFAFECFTMYVFVRIVWVRLKPDTTTGNTDASGNVAPAAASRRFGRTIAL
jgi:hypothetical protein